MRPMLIPYTLSTYALAMLTIAMYVVQALNEYCTMLHGQQQQGLTH